MLLRIKYITFLFLFISLLGYSQTGKRGRRIPDSKQMPDDTMFVAIVGDYYGIKQNTCAIGLALNLTRVTESFGIKPPKHGFAGFSAFYERSFSDRDYWGTSVEFWGGSVLAAGWNINYHQNAYTAIYGLKPSVGIQFFHIAIMYGYNFYKKSDLMPELKHNIFTVRWYFPVWRKK